jgi:Flp pilus assembly protein TadD
MSKAMLVTVPFVLLLLDVWPLRRIRMGEDRKQEAESREQKVESGKRESGKAETGRTGSFNREHEIRERGKGVLATKEHKELKEESGAAADQGPDAGAYSEGRANAKGRALPLTPSYAKASAGRPALSPGERGNDPQVHAKTTVPVAGGQIVHKLPAKIGVEFFKRFWALVSSKPVGDRRSVQAEGFAIPWRRVGGLVWEKWPFFALTLGFCVLTYWVQQTHAAVLPSGRLGWDVRLGNVILSYVRYLGKTLWPADLAVLYPFPTGEHSYLALWPAWGMGLAAAGLLGVTGWCVWQLPRRPYLAVGWLWYVGMMLPVIGLVQVGGQGMADRYTYLPLIGPVLAAGWAMKSGKQKAESGKAETGSVNREIREIRERKKGGVTTEIRRHGESRDFLTEGNKGGPGPENTGILTREIREGGGGGGKAEIGKAESRNWMPALAWVVPAACLWGTHGQLEYWRDTVALFAHTLAVTGDNYMARVTLGYGYEHDGRVEEAVAQYRTAIALSPTDKLGYQALGRLEEKSRAWADAAAAYEAVLQLDPHEAMAHLGLANVLPHLGRNAEAVGKLEAALKDDPSSPELLNNLAWALATSADSRLRDGPRAVQLAEKACALTYHQQTIMIGTLAAAYAEAGRFDEAVAAAQAACASASAKGETSLRQRNEELLGLYQRRQAWHETD